MLSLPIFKNFTALMLLQLGQYLAPLFILPYLTRVLGLEVVGAWLFAQAFVVVARTAVSYGFDLTATRQVAVIRDNPTALSRLYQAVFIARTGIWLLCCVALTIAGLLIPAISQVSALLFFGMLILIGEIIFPTWLFQGAERMSVIAQTKMGAIILNLILVVLFVREPVDVLLVPAIEAATSLLAAVSVMVIAAKWFGLYAVPVGIADVVEQIRDGANVFLNDIAAHLYSTVNVIVVGVMLGPIAVSQFSIATKIYGAFRGLLRPVVGALFPAMAIKFAVARSEFLAAGRTLLIRGGIILLVLASSMYLMADWLVGVIAGKDEEAAVAVLEVLSVALIFGFGSFLSPLLVLQQRSGRLLRITAIGGVIGLITVWPLVTAWGILGAAVSFLVVQIYNTTALFVTYRQA